MLVNKKNLVKILAFAALLLVVTSTQATAGCRQLESEQCERVKKLLKAWKSEPLQNLSVTKYEQAPTYSPEQAHPDSDQAVSRERLSEDDIGPCRYNADEQRVEIAEKVFKYSDENFARCLSIAFGQARYDEIEEKWLEHLGEGEAWVIRKGKFTKVSTEGEGKPVAARSLWVSAASRELVAMVEETPSDSGRQIANDGQASQQDQIVRSLLRARD